MLVDGRLHGSLPLDALPLEVQRHDVIGRRHEQWQPTRQLKQQGWPGSHAGGRGGVRGVKHQSFDWASAIGHEQSLSCKGQAGFDHHAGAKVGGIEGGALAKGRLTEQAS